jgi:hypothetical protein
MNQYNVFARLSCPAKSKRAEAKESASDFGEVTDTV